jgi:hypothetical protein
MPDQRKPYSANSYAATENQAEANLQVGDF